jgi:hypothetical protein
MNRKNGIFIEPCLIKESNNKMIIIMIINF